MMRQGWRPKQKIDGKIPGFEETTVYGKSFRCPAVTGQHLLLFYLWNAILEQQHKTRHTPRIWG
jgi:hypothetical protein